MLATAASRRDWISGRIALVILVAGVLGIAWLQFRWLHQLRDEEEARRRVALRVAASNFQDRVTREFTALLENWQAGKLTSDRVAAQIVVNGTPRLRLAADAQWRRPSTAELQQWLGRPLLAAARDWREVSGVWLQPPTLVECNDECRIAVLTPTAVAAMLAEAAAAVFAEFGDELSVAVTGTGVDGREQSWLYPQSIAPRQFAFTDISTKLLSEQLALGPAGYGWELRINHGGSSLEDAVGRSHLRNVLLSLALLALLAISVGLVLVNARRATRLAQQQIFFVAGVSHELRTPLAVISSAADNLADGAVKTPERAQRYGEMIRIESRRLRTMIENVLQFSRLSSSQGPERFVLIRPEELIDGALEAVRPALGELRPTVEIAADLPTIAGDPDALRSVLVNLLHNAAKYAQGEQRWIALVASLASVRPRGRALRIAVSNPISQAPDLNTERLLDPFYRGRNATDAGITGTGIGLAVARGIARQHGGGLSIDTTRRNVFTINLYLPIPRGTDP